MLLDNYVKNYQTVIDKFGYWPTFHDAEIKRVLMGAFKKENEGYVCPFIEIDVYCFEMTSEIDRKGFFKLKKHSLVTFRFEDVYDVELEGFNHQNATLSIEFTVLEKNERGFVPIFIEIDPAYGLGGEFKAFKAEVVNVEDGS